MFGFRKSSEGFTSELTDSGTIEPIRDRILFRNALSTMNRNLLTVMGCSTSLAFLLATGHTAQADTTTAPSTAEIVQTVPVFEITFEAEKVDPNSDAVGDLAIDKLRCDCQGCRVAVVQTLQSDR